MRRADTDYISTFTGADSSQSFHFTACTERKNKSHRKLKTIRRTQLSPVAWVIKSCQHVTFSKEKSINLSVTESYVLLCNRNKGNAFSNGYKQYVMIYSLQNICALKFQRLQILVMRSQ